MQQNKLQFAQFLQCKEIFWFYNLDKIFEKVDIPALWKQEGKYESGRIEKYPGI